MPKTPAAAGVALVMAALLMVAAMMADGMACQFYASTFAHEGSSEPNPLFEPAQLLDGRLCTAESQCTQAVLIHGILQTTTLEAIAQRAQLAAPAKLTVCLDSPGGDAHVVNESAERLPANVQTCVADVVLKEGRQPAPSICASACAWLWMGAKDRVLFGSRSVGFHAPYYHDAAACVPGNWLRGWVDLGWGWVTDHAAGVFAPDILDVRSQLRQAARLKGPDEVLHLSAQDAVRLGLQPMLRPTAVFYVMSPTGATKSGASGLGHVPSHSS